MKDSYNEIITSVFQGSRIKRVNFIQELWGGYGKISRVEFDGTKSTSVIVKEVSLPQTKDDPVSLNRKIQSYHNEMLFYKEYSKLCESILKIPECYYANFSDSSWIFILEDLDKGGFPGRISQLNITEIKPVIKWLSYFHALFLNTKTKGLWRRGTYWHIDTRKDEFARLSDKKLKSAAKSIALKLDNLNNITLLHGDAKTDNFCFSLNNHSAAAVDFQYTGMGCGMKDLAYFIDSAMNPTTAEVNEEKILNMYFTELKCALRLFKPEVDADSVENEWRPLYKYARLDFYRFLKGWSSLSCYNDKYSEKLLKELF